MRRVKGVDSGVGGYSRLRYDAGGERIEMGSPLARRVERG